MSIEIGQILLGKYRIDDILGKGGMGVVYGATDLRLGRTVAIKILHQKARNADETGRRFLREARTVAQVTHPNLVTLLEFDLLQDGNPAMVMERINGDSLKAMLKARRFSLAEVQEILRQCLSAMAVCHKAHIVHRDLKPGNILVEDQSDELFVSIIDFGLTKMLAGDHSVLTAAGEIFGSPRFMAPEQWNGGTIDARTDLYALGLIGYCLIMGTHFIKPGHPLKVCEAHLTQERPPLVKDAYGTPIPAYFAMALRQAVEVNPNSRFDSAVAMRRAILGQSKPAAKVLMPLPPVVEDHTVLDPRIADKVRKATQTPAPRTVPSVILESDESGLVDPSQMDLEGNAIQSIDRSDFEAALKATNEAQRPILLPARPSLPMALPQKPSGEHPSRAVAAQHAVGQPAPVEEEEALKLWVLALAGLGAAAMAALVVLWLR